VSTVRRALLVPGIVAALLAVVVIAVATSPALRRQVRLSTTHVPESFSVLYFANPQALPVQRATFGAVNVDYVVENHRGRTTAYVATATLTSPGLATATQTQTMTVRDGREARQHLTFPVPSNRFYALTVTLSTGEKIFLRGAAL
jgi:hypothetical protein